MIEAAKIGVKVESNADKVAADVQRLHKTVNDVGRGGAASVKQLEGGFAGLGKTVGGLGDIGKIALGTVLGGAITGAVRGMSELSSEALTAYANYERLGLSLQQLVATEKLNSGEAENMAQALEMAGGQAQELLQWTQKLAIESPFTSSGVAKAYQMSMAYGFTTKEAQRLTKALIDFSAGSGKSEDTMSRVALALGQIQAKGKLAGQEVLQLTEAGLNVNQILANAFGKSTQEIVALREEGLIPAGMAIEAIIRQMESDFGGAAKRQSQTFTGLLSSLEDIREVNLRDFFGPSLEAVQPLLNDFVTALQDPRTRDSIKEAGAAFGNLVGVIIDGAPDATEMIDGMARAGKGVADFFNGLAIPEQGMQKIANTWDQFFTDLRMQGGNANQIGSAFGETYENFLNNINQPGAAGAMVDRNRLQAEALAKFNTVIVQATGSYDEYTQAVVEAGIARGRIDASFRSSWRDMIRDQAVVEQLGKEMGFLTEAQYNVQAAAIQSGGAFEGAVVAQQQYYAATQGTNQAAQELALTLEGMKPTAEENAQALDGISKAWENVNKASQNFNQRVGQGVVGQLEEAGIKGEQLELALGKIDEKLGTSFLMDYQLENNIQGLVEQFKQTGDIEGFGESLGGIIDKFGPLQEGIQNAREEFEKLIADFINANGMKISIDVLVNRLQTGHSGTGGPGSKQVVNKVDDNGQPVYQERAVGGPAYAGKPYMVGEVGPEPFFPAVDGRILSVQQAQDALRGAAGSGRSGVNIVIQKGAIVAPMADANQVVEMLAGRIAEKIQAQRRT
jgi:tape measure domain-containing protein